MADNKYIHDIIKKNLSHMGLDKTWRALLACYINAMVGNGRSDLKQIINNIDTKKINIEHNLLAGLSMGQIAGLYEFSLAHCDRAARKTAGQYFTPDDVAQLMAQKAITNFGTGDKIWCDPCAGVGNLAYHLIAQQPDPESFLAHHMVFIDRDPLALLIARVLLTAHFQTKNKNLFHDLEKKFITADFLTADNVPTFDYAFFNPPYGKVGANVKNPDNAPDLYALFMERVMEKTHHRHGGFHGGFVAVTPQSFTHGKKFLPLREKLLAQAKKIIIYNFDNVPDGLFNARKFGSINSNHANSTRAAITIFKHKTANDDKINFSITPWLRWRAKERATLLARVDDFLTPIKNITPDIFPKIHDDFQELYISTQGKETLASVLSAHPTRHQLFVPTTPRYFISALQKKPNRTSCRTLYFLSAAARDQAYVLLNSSFCYWWWRVNDGGMSLSQRTLLTMPWVNISLAQASLVKEIKLSEKINKVVKRNAGRDNENVKHDIGLLQQLNHAVAVGLRGNLAPRGGNWHGDDFLKLHGNSVLTSRA